MKHLFVPYELAVKLKENGFDEPCLAVYKNGHWLTQITYNSQERKTDVLAPMYQQVVDWLEEKYGIYVGKIGYDDGITPKRFVYHVNKDYCEEQSYEGAIKEALKLI